MRRLLLLVSVSLIASCAHIPRVQLSGGTSAAAPRDNGSPATANEATTTSTIVIPKDSIVTAPTGTTGGIAGVVQAPPITATLAKDSELRVVSTAATASSGTIDTTVATRRIDVAARAPLLYAAIASVVAAGVMIFLKYPTPALCCGGAAIVFFLAYQLSNLPSWFWAVGLAAGVAGVALYFGHERGEKTASAAPTNPSPSVSRPSTTTAANHEGG